MKIVHLTYTATIGMLGGMSSWVLLQLFFYFNERTSFPFFDQFVYEGLIVGIGLGAFTYAREALLNANLVALRRKMSLGLLLGAFSGFICFAFAQSLLVYDFSPLQIRFFSWIFLGVVIGGVTSCTFPFSRRMVYQMLSGGIGGGVGGLLFEICQQIPLDYLNSFAGLIVIGVSIPLFMALVETVTANAYLRVLSGNNEGQVYFLDKDQFSLGYQPQNDIVLTGYAEICEKHARIFKQGSQCFIQNSQNGGQVLINYRLVNQQAMKKGDIVKIGTALLQYCEI